MPFVTFTVVGVDGVVGAVDASVVAGVEELTLAAGVLFVDVVAPEVVVVSTLVDRVSVLVSVLVVVLEATASSELGSELVEPSTERDVFGVLVERPDNGIGAANKQATSAKIRRIVVRGGGGKGGPPEFSVHVVPRPAVSNCLPPRRI